MITATHHERELFKFADENDLVLVVKRNPKGEGRVFFSVFFEDSMIVSGGYPKPCVGVGNTYDEAVADYSKELFGKKLVITVKEPLKKPNRRETRHYRAEPRIGNTEEFHSGEIDDECRGGDGGGGWY